MSKRGIIVAGHPGVGKSTFLKFLQQKHFPNTLHIVSLAEKMGAVPSGFANLEVEQVLHIFAEIQNFFLSILKQANATPNYSTRSEIMERIHQAKNRKIPVVEIARDELLPLAQQIARLQGLPQYYLAIDDVDFIFPRDQTDILDVLCDIIHVTGNPVILYSARPIAAHIALSHIKSHVSSHFAPPIRLDPLDVFEVIVSRFTAISSNKTKNWGPFQNNSAKIKTVIESLSNHNIRTAEGIAESAVLLAIENLKKKNYQYDFDDFINLMYGPESKSPFSMFDADNNRQIQNIFRAMKPADAVPFEFVALYCFSEPKVVNDDFVKYYNKICMKISSKNTPQDGYSKSKVYEIIDVCRGHDFIRRYIHYSHTEFKQIEKADLHKTLEGYEFCLTPKGIFLLELSRNPQYRVLCGFDGWRNEVITNINDLKIETRSIDFSSVSFDDNEK